MKRILLLLFLMVFATVAYSAVTETSNWLDLDKKKDGVQSAYGRNRQL